MQVVVYDTMSMFGTGCRVSGVGASTRSLTVAAQWLFRAATRKALFFEPQVPAKFLRIEPGDLGATRSEDKGARPFAKLFDPLRDP